MTPDKKKPRLTAGITAQFKSHRKDHYNMKAALARGRQLMADEDDE